MVSAMLATTAPIERMPRDCRKLLPADITASELRERILSRHAPIRDQFERGLALAGWRTESDILGGRTASARGPRDCRAGHA